MPISSTAAIAQLFLQRLLNCSCSDCSIVYAIFSTAIRGVDGILVFDLCDVVVAFNAIFPTAVCGVDGIFVLGLCDVVVVFDAISPTADCGVDGILVLELCDVVVVFLWIPPCTCLSTRRCPGHQKLAADCTSRG